MAVITIPQTAVRQKDDQKTLDAVGTTSLSVSWKDSYSVLDAVSVAQDDTITIGGTTYTVKTAALQRLGAGLGQLTLTIAPPDATTSGETPVTRAKREIWLCHSVRNDRSILCYCGSGDYDANRAWIECWQREANADVAILPGYTRPDGTVDNLLTAGHLHQTATNDIIIKLRKGIESVISFYPLVTRKRTYTDCPPEAMVDLGLIDSALTSSAISGSNSVVLKYPKNLGTVIDAYQWLKAQDDVDELSNGDWQRTESWIGAPSWDADLYGAAGTRWTIPHTTAASNS